MKDKVHSAVARLHKRFGIVIAPSFVDYIVKLHGVAEDGSGYLSLKQAMEFPPLEECRETSAFCIEGFLSWVSQNMEYAEEASELKTAIECSHQSALTPAYAMTDGPQIPTGFLRVAGTPTGDDVLIGPTDQSPVLVQLRDRSDNADLLSRCVKVADNWDDLMKRWVPEVL